MARETDKADLAILLGLLHEFHGAARGEHVIDVLHVHHVVDLVEVDIVGLQPGQALVQVQFGVAVGAVAGLRSENVLVPRDTLQRDPVPSLAEPIRPRCRGVEVVDPGLIAVPDRAQSLGLVPVRADAPAAKAKDRHLQTGLPELPARYRVRRRRGGGQSQPCRGLNEFPSAFCHLRSSL